MNTLSVNTNIQAISEAITETVSEAITEATKMCIRGILEAKKNIIKDDFLDLETQYMYEELLNYYTSTELNGWIDEYGENAIRLIYEAEFGLYYSREMEDDEYETGGE